MSQYVFQREDWPFSKFGMYSGFQAGREKCVYSIRTFLNDQEEPDVAIWKDIDWYYGLLENQGCPFSGNFEKIFDSPAQKIRVEKSVQRVTVQVHLKYWHSWQASNLNSPDESRILFEKTYEN